jgi:uncharacterized membrane protein YeaQ/YmgE (transglycosylase-associated protein family)
VRAPLSATHRPSAASAPAAAMHNAIASAARVLACPRPCVARPDSNDRGGEKTMGIMSIIWMIIIGFIVGLLARFFYPGAINLGFWMTTLLGIGGSVVGGIVGGLFSRSPDGRFHAAGLIMSIIGAMILLWAYLNFYVTK